MGVSGPVKSYYDLFDVPRSASADEIKRAFRKEIAKYHPDKVQHLGEEFQAIAVVKAAELTHAYKILSDSAARADYDAQLEEGVAPDVAEPVPAAVHADVEPAHAPPHARSHGAEPPSAPSGSLFEQDRAGATELIRKATLMRFRSALETEFGSCEAPAVAGCEVACVPKQAFWTLRVPPAILGRFLPQVDGPALSETWSLAMRMKRDTQRDVCVFVMGPSLAPAGELARVIADQRRRPTSGAGKVVVIPVNTSTWNAHVPTDAPPVVKSLLAKLKQA
jgi:hypothetical protein